MRGEATAEEGGRESGRYLYIHSESCGGERWRDANARVALPKPVEL